MDKYRDGHLYTSQISELKDSVFDNICLPFIEHAHRVICLRMFEPVRGAHPTSTISCSLAVPITSLCFNKRKKL